MRAVHFDGRRDQRVDVPSWVTFRPLELGALACECKTCGQRVEVRMSKRDAERQMGTFALWHRRCGELPFYEEAQRQQAYLKERAARREYRWQEQGEAPRPLTFIRGGRRK